MGIDALWNPLYRPVSGSNFNWYAGFGPSFFLGGPFAFGIAGEIGIEYAFSEIPIVIGADRRPNFRIVEDTNFLADQFGLDIRWKSGGRSSSSFSS